MRRRELLGGVGAAAAAGLAGCGAGYRGKDGNEAVVPPTGGGAPVELPVPWSDIRQPLPRDAIPAVVDPVFAPDWSGVDPELVGREGLGDDAAVVGVERDGAARAYPLAVLNRHEVVNDQFAGPLLVTYCPLCGSAVAAERRVAGRPATFGVSGALWRRDLVLYDAATESLWSQLLATAIRGPRTGDRLSLVPTRLTSWGAWRDTHPETEVLLPPPHSGTIDGSSPYEYDEKYPYGAERQLVGFDGEAGGGEVGRSTLVVGIVDDGVARAYPHFAVRPAGGVVTDRVGEVPVVVTTTPGGGLAAYDRRVGGRPLSFTAVDGPEGAWLRGGGSRWARESGRAVDGPHEGRRLTRANELAPLFWHAWAAFHPRTELYGRERDADT
jgi:hypothetical protein